MTFGTARSVLECAHPLVLSRRCLSFSAATFTRSESGGEPPHSKTWRAPAAVLALLACVTATVRGLTQETFTDDFTSGRYPVSWTIISNVPLYSVDSTAVTFDNFALTADELARPPARFAVDWFTVDGGGGETADGRFTITGTIGQHDPGEASNGRFTVTAGFWAAAIAVQTLGAPTLSILPTGPGLATISWDPPTPGFVLQVSDTLAPVAWSDASSGATNPITVPATPSTRFYRLFRP